MTRQIVPIFLPNRGCPHRCIFCNEKIAAGDHPERITREHIADQIALYFGNGSGTERQIAFYGGNFTGIDPNYQKDLLEIAQTFVNSGVIASIRVSTRPDYIDRAALQFLKQYSVKTVEIGAQSMIDAVLVRCDRGHTAEDTGRAVRLLREFGFETGVHLMVGLPGDDRRDFEETVNRVVALKPEMARIHPTLVFADTKLADLYRSGQYVALDLEEAVDHCKYALARFRESGIDVIRIGLQSTAQMEEPGAILAGPFHPAFRSLVEGSIFLDMAEDMLSQYDFDNAEDTLPSFRVCAKDISDFRGISNRNIARLQKRYGMEFSVLPDGGLRRGDIILETGGKRFYKSRSQNS